MGQLPRGSGPWQRAAGCAKCSRKGGTPLTPTFLPGDLPMTSKTIHPPARRPCRACADPRRRRGRRAEFDSRPCRMPNSGGVRSGRARLSAGQSERHHRGGGHAREAEADSGRTEADALWSRRMRGDLRGRYSWVGGNPEGDMTVVEFMDYRCGYCRSAHPEVLGTGRDRWQYPLHREGIPDPRRCVDWYRPALRIATRLVGRGRGL